MKEFTYELANTLRGDSLTFISGKLSIKGELQVNLNTFDIYDSKGYKVTLSPISYEGCFLVDNDTILIGGK